LSKNTRWALAIVGVAIIVIAAFAISSGKDDTKAEQAPTEQTPITPVTPATTGRTGPATPDPTSESGAGSPDTGEGSGGAVPDSSGEGTGGASPQKDTGGAQAEIGMVSPILGAGPVRTVSVDKGEYVVIRARSAESGELHVHGYDKEVALKPDQIARVKFKATIDGEFPIEFHLPGGETQVGTLRVNP
jgi:hypothetical protein